MAFIQKPTTTSKTVTKTAPIGGSDATSIGGPITAVGGGVDAISSSSALTKALNPSSGLADITKSISSASKFLSTTLSSGLDTFDKTKKGLASGINGVFKDIFGDTNVASASSVATKISDPITTNLLAKKRPGATSFRVTGFETGSQAIDPSQSRDGTGAGQMAGTNWKTLLARLNRDIGAAKDVIKIVNGDFSKQRLNGLFNQVSAKVGFEASKGIADPQLRSFISSASSGAVATAVGIAPKGQILQQTLRGGSTFLSKDAQEFTATVSSISRQLGGADLSSYFVSNPKYSLVDDQKNPIFTRQSGVDAGSANQVLNLARNAGCVVSRSEYFSANQNLSYFGLGLGLAANYGLEDLLAELLGCSQARTSMGQQVVGQAFTESVFGNLDFSKTLLDNVDAPQKLYTPDIGISILTSPNIAGADKGTVDAIFAALGTTTKAEMSVKGPSSSKYPVFDAPLMAQMKPSFTNAVFQDKTVTDYFKSQPMALLPNGKLGFA